jgi:hypothetical protein
VEVLSAAEVSESFAKFEGYEVVRRKRRFDTATLNWFPGVLFEFYFML